MLAFFAGLPALIAIDESSLWWPDVPGGTSVRHAEPLAVVIEAARNSRDLNALRALTLVGLSLLKVTPEQRTTRAWQLVEDLMADDWIVTPGGQIVGRRVA